MQVMLAVAILVVGLGMLGLAAGFTAYAVRRTRARESLEIPDAEMAEPYQPPAVPPALASPRGMWTGAGISAALGMGALIGAAIVLTAIMTQPSRTLNAPAQAGGLQRDDSPDTQQLTARQRERMRAAGMPNPLTAVYRQPSTLSSTVLFIGASGHLAQPTTQLRQLLSGLAESAGAAGREPTGYPAGHLKGTVMCMDELNTGQVTLVTCGWADEGTLGVITTDQGDAAQTADLLLSMREDMEKKV